LLDLLRAVFAAAAGDAVGVADVSAFRLEDRKSIDLRLDVCMSKNHVEGSALIQ